MSFENNISTPINNDADQNISPEEISAVKKDMHMTGRAMRIDETMDEYKAEREKSWTEIEQQQASQDQAAIESARQFIANIDSQEPRPNEQTENYEDLPNVILAKQKLKKILEDNKNNSNMATQAETILYEMLTRRSEFISSTDGAGKNAADLLQDNKTQVEWYRNTRANIEQMLNQGSEFKWDSNPGWFGINTRPEEAKRESTNIKAYVTIPSGEYPFIQHLPQLAQELRQLSLETDDIIQVKVPESFSAFFAHNDSIVVHFKNKDNANRILEILNTWMQSNDIHEAPREMGRTKIAADSKDKSFSSLVASNIASWLEQNAGKYDSNILINEAVKHSIRQSQQSSI